MKVLISHICILLTLVAPQMASAAIDKGPEIFGIKLHIERVGNMTHFEFEGQKEWELIREF